MSTVLLYALSSSSTNTQSLPHNEADLVEAISENTIVFAGSASYPPFQWLDRNGHARGLLVELEQSMAAQASYSSRHILTNWRHALDLVLNGEADVVALVPSAERAEYFDFTEPFYFISHGIFSNPANKSYRRLTELEGSNVAVVNGSYAHDLLAFHSPHLQLVDALDELQCVQFVDEGKADACVEAATTSRHLIAAHKLNVEQTSPPFWPVPYSFAVRKGNQEMLDIVRQQLAVMHGNGTFDRIYSRWQPELEWTPRSIIDDLRTFLWVLIFLLAAALTGFLWSWSLKREVKRKTSSLNEELKTRKLIDAKLQYAANFDTLTGLFNRAAFTSVVERELAKNTFQKPTLLTIRIANFESVITAFSYSIACELLQAFADRFAQLPFIHTAHFGEGLFAALVDEDFSSEQIIDNVCKPLELNNLDIEPQTVAGLVRVTKNSTTTTNADEYIRRSLTALSVAYKNDNIWLNYIAGMEPSTRDLTLLRDFHRYGTRDFCLHYQPKANLASGIFKSAEALVRWQHPDFGLVSPAVFIPLLEKSGLISQVSRWVITETVEMIKRNNLQNFKISVNVSTRDLAESGLVDFIREATNDIPRKCLLLEITETGFINDSNRTSETLEELSALGIDCLIDDFGTGNSSLSYLSRFHLAGIKLDRSYVFDITSNTRNRIIVKSTLELAQALKLSVTAEGVETPATVQLLHDMGCDVVQGYVFSKPVSEQEVVTLLGEKITYIQDVT